MNSLCSMDNNKIIYPSQVAPVSFEIQLTLHDHPYKELPRVFAPEEINRILYRLKRHKFNEDRLTKWIRLRNETIFIVTYELALRPKEALTLKLSDIDFNANILRIAPEGNKLRRGRTLAFNDVVRNALLSYLNYSKLNLPIIRDYIFPTTHSYRLTVDRWSEVFRDILKELNIYSGKESLYTLRHTKATEVYEKTSDLLLVANILGHKRIDCTKVYVHLALMRTGYLDKMRNALAP